MLDDLDVRTATPDDRLDVRRVLDGAVLSVPALSDRLASGDVLVAALAGTVCGAAVVAPEGPSVGAEGPSVAAEEQSLAHEWTSNAHVEAIAVRRRRRGRGVGTALVRAALDRYGPLIADFDADVRAFYESLDGGRRDATPDGGGALSVTIRRSEDDRCWALVRRRSARGRDAP